MRRTGFLAAALLAFGLIAPAGAQPAQPDPAHGESVFQARCGFCHSLDGPGQGPDLNGVVGRKAAAAPDFNYSAAMTASGLTWTAPQLDQFLTDPSKLVPGSPMQAMVTDPNERRDLIAYLATLKAR